MKCVIPVLILSALSAAADDPGSDVTPASAELKYDFNRGWRRQRRRGRSVGGGPAWD